MRPPPVRKGRLKWRAICPVHSSPIADSGVPNCGEPDCMSILERKDPKTTGAPGRINCVSAMPVRVSAICWASVAGIDTGDMAPMSRNGVRITGCIAHMRDNRIERIEPEPESVEKWVAHVNDAAKEVADFYAFAFEEGERRGVEPCFEIHVNMWSEDFRRVASVASSCSSMWPLSSGSAGSVDQAVHCPSADHTAVLAAMDWAVSA